MCTSTPKSCTLPAQNVLCIEPNSGCRSIELKTGWRKWEKRTAVLVRGDENSESKLHIYTYFLKGIGAGLSRQRLE
ncbi:hypothetical protein GCK72_018632 [Caenorhabditis remanei]|uniref:PH-15 domain-containing protein n=1 Tax=Caenorhabditis remanei TaxID=31234 RepID=A0A6A5GAF4_CAERE|nr:hypothetical protein GCK72_018632 [Caenorhabditis remanei]KAF1752078.1 hypothetical protein GCK72_018632 [Caenorhabditis remanei]